MLPLLHRFCFALWGLGLAGMSTTKGLADNGHVFFDVAALFSVVGVVSLCCLLALDLACRARSHA